MEENTRENKMGTMPIGKLLAGADQFVPPLTLLYRPLSGVPAYSVPGTDGLTARAVM